MYITKHVVIWFAASVTHTYWKIQNIVNVINHVNEFQGIKINEKNILQYSLKKYVFRLHCTNEHPTCFKHSLIKKNIRSFVFEIKI